MYDEQTGLIAQPSTEDFGVRIREVTSNLAALQRQAQCARRLAARLPPGRYRDNAIAAADGLRAEADRLRGIRGGR